MLPAEVFVEPVRVEKDQRLRDLRERQWMAKMGATPDAAQASRPVSREATNVRPQAPGPEPDAPLQDQVNESRARARTVRSSSPSRRIV